MATQTLYGTTKDGKEITQFTLKNKSGLEVRCINYGCRLTHLFVPSPTGEIADILLGYDTFAEYEADPSSQGSFVGRFANRIEDANFTIGEETYQLEKTSGDNFLHGNFSHCVFDAEVIGDNSISFTYTSPDGDQGFPGELWVGVTYTLTEDDELILDYRAVSQKATHVNFTNHSYFNMAGQGSGTVEDQTLWLNSTQFLEAKPNLCPTGRILEVEGGAFDFTTEKPIGRDINADDPQLKHGGGYDHCFILQQRQPGKLSPAAIATDPKSGRIMHLYTTQPSIQVYTANGTQIAAGKNGVAYGPRSGFCLETQHYPNSPNQPDFPTTLLRAKDKYHQITMFCFNRSCSQ